MCVGFISSAPSAPPGAFPPSCDDRTHPDVSEEEKSREEGSALKVSPSPPSAGPADDDAGTRKTNLGWDPPTWDDPVGSGLVGGAVRLQLGGFTAL